MAASDSVNDVAGWLDDRLAEASPDLLRAMIKQFAETLIGRRCGRGVRGRLSRTQRGPDELAQRLPGPGVGHPRRHGGVGDPKLRSGSYFPEWLLERRRRAEQALVSVVATSYLLGVSTRRVEKLVGQLGIAELSKSTGQRDGQESRRAGGGVPVAPAGRRSVYCSCGWTRSRRRCASTGAR